MIKIVDLYATWCRPCAQMHKTLEKLQTELEFITVEKIDVEEDDTLVKEFKIKSVPTLLLFKDGKMVEKVTGTITDRQLITILKTHEYFD